MIQLPGNDDVAATAEGNSSLYSHRRRTTQTPKEDIRKSLKFNTNMSFSSYSVPQGCWMFFRQRKKGVGFPSKKTSQMTSTNNALKKRLKKRCDVGNKKKNTLPRPSSAGCVLYNVPPQSCIPRAEKKKTTTPSRGQDFLRCRDQLGDGHNPEFHFIGKAVGSKQFRMCGQNISCNFGDLWSATSFRQNRFMQHTLSNYRIMYLQTRIMNCTARSLLSCFTTRKSRISRRMFMYFLTFMPLVSTNS